MTPAWDVPWLIVGLAFAAFLVWLAFRRRRPPVLSFSVTGPPVTAEIEALLAPYGHGAVVGVVQMPTGLVVSYDNGVRLTFSPRSTYNG